MKKGQNISEPGLGGIVIRFAIFLKTHGFKVFQNRIHDAIISLRYINIFNKQDFFSALRANMVSTDMEWRQFSHLFDEFWDLYINTPENSSTKNKAEFHPYIEDVSDKKEPIKKENKKSDISSDMQLGAEKQYLEGIGYSPVSKIEKKEISLFSETDIQIARLALKNIAQPFKIQKTRRTKKGLGSGTYMDFPNIMRKSLKFGGYPFELFFKEKQKRLKRLIIIADVSGSMERYASLVIPFILSIRGVSSKAEVFVFSTSLTRITHIIKHLDLKKTLRKISKEVSNWAGGTRTGFSLKQFNQWNGGTLVSKRSVVIILSDGWDLGSKELLKKEMETLHKKAYSIIWLNPILNDPQLQRMCRGMQVALPYIDHLIPVNNLEALKRAGRLISRVISH